jgi:DNA-binding transcriptional MerR regulator
MRGENMNTDINALFRDCLEKIAHTDYIKPSEVPDIELYMDQVTKFMDSHLGRLKRYDDDKILTKTMINNYAKNNLLPPPVKKKYTHEHILVLSFIYYMKHFLSIGDIQALLSPILNKYFDAEDGFGMNELYEEELATVKGQIGSVISDIEEKYKTAGEAFENRPDSEKDLLQLFTFICMLSYDVYAKKHMIEQLIDCYFTPLMEEEKEAAKNQKKKS